MAKRDNVTITNISQQMIPLQVKPPNGDFYLEERQARLSPGKSISLPRNYLNQAQIENLQSRNCLAINSN